MSSQVNYATKLASMGLSNEKALESSLTFHPGAQVKALAATSGTKQDGSSVAVPEGSVMTVIGVGGGHSGVDPQVQLADGTVCTVPFDQVMEGVKLRRSGRRTERHVPQHSTNEDLTGAVASVTLDKPLPDGAKEWLEGGYAEYGVMLPMAPAADSATSMTFFMKADDEDILTSSIEILKKLAGASFKSTKAATLMDWEKATAPAA